MNKFVYAIRDVKTVWLDPFVDQNDDSAIRGFHYALANRPDIIGFSPKDFSLYRIGEYDSEKGLIKSCIPVLLVEASDLMYQISKDGDNFEE